LVARVRTWVIAASLCSVLVAATARAEPPLVTTVVDECVPIDRAQLDRLLSIELGTSAQTAASTATGPTHVHVRCVDAGIELNLQDALTQKGMVRVLSRDSFKDASSTRLLALAIAEFVVASWVELRLPRKVEPEPMIGPAPATERAKQAAAMTAGERVRPAASKQTHTELGLTGQLQVWSEQADLMLGTGLRFVHAPVSSVAFSIGGDFAATSVDTVLGRVTVRTFAFSLAGLGRIDLDPFVLVTGPGGRIGLAQLSASPNDPNETEPKARYAPYGGVFWLARGALFVADGFALTLEVELGAATLPVAALVGEPPVAAFELDGVWLTTGLGIAFEP
jgi:hypothetical protein